MSQLNKSTKALARRLRPALPCTHAFCSTAHLARTRPPARLAARLPHLRPFATSLPARQAQFTQARMTVELKDRVVDVHLPDGRTTSFHHVWLRDHCREYRSYHSQTRQRLVDTAAIPFDLKPTSLSSTDAGLVVSWPAIGTETAYDSFFPWSFLVKHAYQPPVVPSAGKQPVRRITTQWGKEIAETIPQVTYAEVMETEEGVWEWLRRIEEYGFAFVSGVPPTPEATEQLVRRIAFTRETHYGGFWDFTADLAHGDLAYSDVLLRAHTDTTYFTDPCGLQLFHLLSPPSTHTGGLNLLVDGFRAAALLRERHPAAHALLSTLPVPAHASGSGSASLPSGVHMAPLVAKPVLEHSGGELVQVRWNGDDRGAVGGPGWEGKMEGWFEAVRQWEAILRDEGSELWTRMEPGTAIIFDNHRVLHGRSSFSGTRRLCGTYVSGDDYRSRLAGLRKQFGQEKEGWEEGLEQLGVRKSAGEEGGVWDGY